MNTYATFPVQKPGMVTVIGFSTLISGIANVFWGLFLSMSFASSIIGILCVPLTILPAILGIFEIVYAAKLIGDSPQPIQPSQRIAVLEIISVSTGNVFAMAVGILSLIFYNDLAVKTYFDHLNGIPKPHTIIETPQTAPQAVPAQPAEEQPEPPTPDTESPAKVRRPRKVA